MNPSPTDLLPNNNLRPGIVVLGAAGRLGRMATLAFAREGWRVLAQSRRPLAGGLPAGVQALQTPLDDTAAAARTVHARFGRVDAVLNALNPLYTRWDTDAVPLGRAAIALARALDARLLFPGNVYNHGRALPARLVEPAGSDAVGVSPIQPPAWPDKGAIRTAMEADIAHACAQGLRATVLRAGDFFGGEARGSWFDQVIVRSLPSGRLTYPGPLDRDHAWAYLPDLAEAFVAVARHPAPAAFQAYGFAGHTATGTAFLAALEQAADGLGLRPAHGWRHAGLPWTAVRIAGLVWPMGRALADMRYLWERPHAIDGAGPVAAVGPLRTTPLVSALTAALRDLDLAAPAAAPDAVYR